MAVFFGGGAGSALRFAVQALLPERLASHFFPWGTLTVNVAGSFLIGLFYAVSPKMGLSPDTRLFLTAGLCGGFTTFSTFSMDNIAMIRGGEWFLAAVYTLLSIVLGLLACCGGAVIGKS